MFHTTKSCSVARQELQLMYIIKTAATSDTILHSTQVMEARALGIARGIRPCACESIASTAARLPPRREQLRADVHAGAVSPLYLSCSHSPCWQALYYSATVYGNALMSSSASYIVFENTRSCVCQSRRQYNWCKSSGQSRAGTISVAHQFASKLSKQTMVQRNICPRAPEAV